MLGETELSEMCCAYQETWQGYFLCWMKFRKKNALEVEMDYLSRTSEVGIYLFWRKKCFGRFLRKHSLSPPIKVSLRLKQKCKDRQSHTYILKKNKNSICTLEMF